MSNTNRTKTFGIRFDPDTYALIRQVAKSRGIDLSDLVRELVRKELARLSLLTADEQRALGMEGRL